MKKLLIGLLALVSVSTYAGTNFRINEQIINTENGQVATIMDINDETKILQVSYKNEYLNGYSNRTSSVEWAKAAKTSGCEDSKCVGEKVLFRTSADEALTSNITGIYHESFTVQNPGFSTSFLSDISNTGNLEGCTDAGFCVNDIVKIKDRNVRVAGYFNNGDIAVKSYSSYYGEIYEGKRVDHYKIIKATDLSL